MKLEGQQVVVVGGSSGIGRAVARLAAERGANVTIMGRSGERLAEASDALGGVRSVAMDVADETQVNRAFAGFDAIDHVYIAAGTAKLGGFLDGAVNEIMAPFVERIWGAVYVVRAVVGKIPAGGSVTFTGGLSTDRPVPGAWVSGIGTAAAEQLARVLALELAPVRFNAVSPGWTDTPMMTRLLGDAKESVFNNLAEKLPVKRVATPDEVAESVLLLMGNRSMTGEIIHVDGGARLI